MTCFSDYKKKFETTNLWQRLLDDRKEFADGEQPDLDKDFYWEDYVSYVFDSMALLWEDFTENSEGDADYDPCMLFLLSPNKTDVYRHLEDKDMWQIRETKLHTGWKVLRYVHLSDLYEQDMKDYWKDVDEDEE